MFNKVSRHLCPVPLAVHHKASLRYLEEKCNTFPKFPTTNGAAGYWTVIRRCFCTGTCAAYTGYDAPNNGVKRRNCPCSSTTDDDNSWRENVRNCTIALNSIRSTVASLAAHYFLKFPHIALVQCFRNGFFHCQIRFLYVTFTVFIYISHIEKHISHPIPPSRNKNKSCSRDSLIAAKQKERSCVYFCDGHHAGRHRRIYGEWKFRCFLSRKCSKRKNHDI